jgi:hypothetical protein
MVPSKSLATGGWAEPAEEAFDHPAARQHGESHMIRQLAHNLDDDARDIGHPLPGIGSVGKYPLDEGKPAGMSAAMALRRRDPARRLG